MGLPRPINLPPRVFGYAVGFVLQLIIVVAVGLTLELIEAIYPCCIAVVLIFLGGLRL